MDNNMQNMDAMWIMEGRVGKMDNDMKDMEEMSDIKRRKWKG